VLRAQSIFEEYGHACQLGKRELLDCKLLLECAFLVSVVIWGVGAFFWIEFFRLWRGEQFEEPVLNVVLDLVFIELTSQWDQQVLVLLR